MRFDLDTLTEIRMTLSSNRRRTILTGFGIFWGIFMLLFLQGGGQGLKQMLSKNFEGFASNSVIIASGTTSKPYKGMKKGRSWDLRTGDVDILRNMIPELDIITPMIGKWGQAASYAGHEFSSNVKCVDADYALVENVDLRFGRFINSIDVAQERKVCVLGKNVYEKLFPDGSDPCGKSVQVGAVYYTVIGVNFAESNINIQGPSSKAVLIPISVGQKVYHLGDHIHLICMTGKSGVTMSEITGKIRQCMGRTHIFDPSDTQAMFLMNAEEMFSMVDGLFKGLNFLILLVGLGTILAGAIGVSNIMMVNVKARTVEIGIRRAIGATPSDILGQNMLEGITLIFVAGILGILFSVGLLALIERFSGSTAFQISFGTAVGALVLLAALGVVAGLAPAYRAMKIRPVDAMRDE